MQARPDELDAGHGFSIGVDELRRDAVNHRVRRGEVLPPELDGLDLLSLAGSDLDVLARQIPIAALDVHAARAGRQALHLVRPCLLVHGAFGVPEPESAHDPDAQPLDVGPLADDLALDASARSELDSKLPGPALGRQGDA